MSIPYSLLPYLFSFSSSLLLTIPHSLKFSFINVGEPDGTLNDKVSPVLSTCFSDVFTVWSAKKFPGVKESTPLSKCFAAQGVKIPIRKDGGGKGGKGGDGEDFEGDE